MWQTGRPAQTLVLILFVSFPLLNARLQEADKKAKEKAKRERAAAKKEKEAAKKEKAAAKKGKVGGRAGLLAACQTAWTAVGKLAVNAEKGWRIGCLYASLAVCLCVCVQEKAKKEKESAAKRKSSGGAAPSAKVCGLRGGDGVRGGVKCTCCATTASLLPALWLLTCSCVGCGCCCCCCCCRKPRRRLSQRQRRRAR